MQDLPDLVISNATVVNADGRTNAHVVVAGGKITELVDAAYPVPRASASIAADGRLLIPGGVDGHCHVAQVTGRYRTLDDYAVTSSAALWGGTTTLIDFGIRGTLPKARWRRPATRSPSPVNRGATSDCTPP